VRVDIFGRRTRVEKEIRADFADFVATSFAKVVPQSLVAPNYARSSRSEIQDTVLHLWCLGALEYFCSKHGRSRSSAIDLYREHLIRFRDANSTPEADGVLRSLIPYLPKLEFSAFLDRGRNCAKGWDARRIANPSEKLQAVLETARVLRSEVNHAEDSA
jgi:hypothetical protein